MYAHHVTSDGKYAKEAKGRTGRPPTLVCIIQWMPPLRCHIETVFVSVSSTELSLRVLKVLVLIIIIEAGAWECHS